MDSRTCTVILDRVAAARQKAAADPDAFASAVQQMAASQVKADAARDIANVGLAGLGVGAAGRGLLGLIHTLRANREKRTRSGPAYLPLPFPAEKTGVAAFGLGGAASIPGVAGLIGGDSDRSIAERAVRATTRTTGGVLGGTVGGVSGGALGAILAGLLTRKNPIGVRAGAIGGAGLGGVSGVVKGDAWVGKPVADYITTDKSRLMPKQAGFLSGDAATSKSGVPWYGPAMLLGGMGGLAAGWKGLDAVLASRRRREQKADMEAARREFHDALMSQYAEPIKTHPRLVKGAGAADGTMAEVGRRLDALFDAYEKAAVDWGDAAGKATGAYGMYAGLSGLLTGAMVYDRIQKRSRRAVLEKALQKRQRRRFMQQPTQIMAVPEPVEVPAGAAA